MNMVANVPLLGDQPDLIPVTEESERLLIVRAQGGDTEESEGQLIRRAQGGDIAARDKLQHRYHGWRVKRCEKFYRAERWPFIEWNDLLATAWLAFSDAIKGFDPAWNNGLAAYAAKWVDGALTRLCRSSYDLGIVDESNAGRWLRSHWHEDITPEEVVKAAGGTLQGAQTAIWAEAAASWRLLSREM
jgi:hypothetical protein